MSAAKPSPETLAHLRDAIGAFFARELPPAQVRELDEAGEMPPALWRRLGELGWLGLPVPAEYGGAGAGVRECLAAVEEIARHFPSIAADYILVGMAARLLLDHGSAAQQRTWLPGLVSGDCFLAFGISEPSGGTDALAMITRAQLDQQADQWIVVGQKLWTSLAHQAAAIIVVARTDPVDPGHRARGLSLIITPTDQPGLQVRRVPLSGMRAAGTCEVFFDDARAPAANLVGQRGRGFHHLLGALNVERTLAAGISLGIAYGALEDAIAYARQRIAFGRPIGAFQAIQHPLAESAAELEAARLLAERAADELDAGRQPNVMVAMAKLFAAEVAVRAADRGMRVMAAHGLSAESGMQRFFRDARLQTFSPISNEMLKNIIAEGLGLPRSY